VFFENTRPSRSFASQAEAIQRYLKVSGLEGLVDPASEEARLGSIGGEGGYGVAMDPRVFSAVGPSIVDIMGAVRVLMRLAETIANAETMELDYVMIPRATFCQPQIASFGWTEDQAKEKGFDVRVAKFPFTANGKAHGLGETAGFVKILSDARYGELLGAHLIGPEVTELLPELTLAQQWDLTVNEVARNVHGHPTLGEAVKEAIHGLAGHMINM